MPATIIILLLIVVVVVAVGWKLLQARRGNDTPTAVPHLHIGEAQEVVNALRKQPAPPVRPRLDGGQVAASAEFRRLIAAGLRIEAIKYYHTATGCGLAEAKAALDKAVEEQGK